MCVRVVCGDYGGEFETGQETDYTIVAQISLDLGVLLLQPPQQIPGAAHHTRLSLWLLKHHLVCNAVT